MYSAFRSEEALLWLEVALSDAGAQHHMRMVQEALQAKREANGGQS
jgi:hypothetical protein